MARKRKTRSVSYGVYKQIEVYPNRLVIDKRNYKSDVETYDYFKRIKEEGNEAKLFGNGSKKRYGIGYHSKIIIN